MLGQDRPLLFYVLRENRKENQHTQLRAVRHVEDNCTHIMTETLYFIAPFILCHPHLYKSSLRIPNNRTTYTYTLLSLGKGLSSTEGHLSAGLSAESVSAKPFWLLLEGSQPASPTGSQNGR